MSESSMDDEYQDFDYGQADREQPFETDSDEEEEDQYEQEGYEEGEEEEGEEELDPENEERLAEEEKQIKELLKHTSYETLLKLKKEDSGLSSFSKKIKKERITARPPADQKKDQKAKSKSKTMPKERNARIPVSRYQTIVKSTKPKTRDPRFDGLSGTLNQELFKKSYGFLIDQKESEIKTLQQTISAARRGGKKKKYSEDDIRKLKGLLGKNKEEMNRFKQNEDVVNVKRESKKVDGHKPGKAAKPFFAKKSELKKKLLEKKFNELDRNKKLQKVMDDKKKRQSNRILGEFRKLQKATNLRNLRNQKEAAAAGMR